MDMNKLNTKESKKDFTVQKRMNVSKLHLELDMKDMFKEDIDVLKEYGDGWKVSISCDDEYTLDDNGVWYDTKGQVVEVDNEYIREVIDKHRPICVEKDGIELVDDIGGIGGFCDMLRLLYDYNMDNEDEMEEREGMLSWAKMMGWTGRRVSPKNTL